MYKQTGIKGEYNVKGITTVVLTVYSKKFMLRQERKSEMFRGKYILNYETGQALFPLNEIY